MEQSIQRMTVTAGQVAEMFGLSEGTFRNKVRNLTEAHGFPEKLPGSKHWSRPVVEDWFRNNGQKDTAPAPAPAPADPLAARQEARHG